MVFVPSDSLPCARGVPPIERYDLISGALADYPKFVACACERSLLAYQDWRRPLPQPIVITKEQKPQWIRYSAHRGLRWRKGNSDEI